MPSLLSAVLATLLVASIFFFWLRSGVEHLVAVLAERGVLPAEDDPLLVAARVRPVYFF